MNRVRDWITLKLESWKPNENSYEITKHEEPKPLDIIKS